VNRDRIRRIGALVLILAAVLVWFTMGPDGADRSVEDVISEYEANDILADSAPQQTVTNGWVARDLLTIIAQQQGDNRVPALVGLLVLGMALALATSPASTPAPSDPSAPRMVATP
jgi:hypothetical protein